MVKIPLSLLLIPYNAMNYRLVEKKVPLSLSCCIEKGIEIFFAFDNPWRLEKDLIARGEKPSIYLDIPVDIKDYEMIELFDWQEEVKDMISQLEFVRMVDVQSETIDKYLKEGKIIADLEIPIGEKRSFKYFKNEKINAYAKQFGWDLITPSNMKKNL